MKRRKIIVGIIVCCLISCLCFTGCGASSGTRKITVNLLAQTMNLKKVTYYDFFNLCKVTDYNGKCAVISNTLNSKEVWFTDAEGRTRVANLSSELAKKPKKINLYTNKAKTEYHTYECTFD